MSPLRPAAWDATAAGLAVALGALAIHALSFLVASMPAPLDTMARVIAYVLLPGAAAARRLPGHAARGTWETAAIALGMGAALFGAMSAVARLAHVSAEALLLVLAALALVCLAPRSSTAPLVAAQPLARPAAHPAASSSARTRTRT